MQRTRSRGRRAAATALTAALAAGIALFTAAPAAAAPAGSVAVAPSATSIQEGGAVDLGIDLTDLADVYAYELVLEISPAILTADTDSIVGPDGGFDAVSSTGGTTTITHTRLGTSPTLAGDYTGSLGFTATGSGTVTITATLTLLDADGVATELAPVVVPAIVVAPAPVEETEPPTATETPGSTDPAVDPDADEDGTEDGSSTAGTDGSLASTGFAIGGFIALAALVLGAGAILVLRSRTRAAAAAADAAPAEEVQP